MITLQIYKFSICKPLLHAFHKNEKQLQRALLWTVVVWNSELGWHLKKNCRVPCKKEGGIRFTISGNPYFVMVLVWNVGGAGDITSMMVKGSDKVKWTPMQRNWGQKWQTNAKLVGESLTFRVRASDGRTSTSWHVAPKNWQFSQTFEGKNFK